LLGGPGGLLASGALVIAEHRGKKGSQTNMVRWSGRVCWNRATPALSF